MQKHRATASKEIGLSKPILQRMAMPRNRSRRIVAPEGAGSSPVGHPPLQGKHEARSVSGDLFERSARGHALIPPARAALSAALPDRWRDDHLATNKWPGGI